MHKLTLVYRVDLKCCNREGNVREQLTKHILIETRSKVNRFGDVFLVLQ